MTLAHPRSLSCIALLSLLVSLSGCGNDFVEFSMDDPGGGGGGAGTTHVSTVTSRGGSSSSVAGVGGAAPLVGGSGGSGATAGSAASGGSDPVVIQAAGGDESVGGEAPVGGSAGSGPVEPAMLLDLIDDVEGKFPSLPLRSGRNGAWFSVHDNTYGDMTAANAFALDASRSPSHFAAQFKGQGFTDWGAQMGVSLKSPSAAYDASPYCGIRFLARGSGSGWTFLISDRQSVPQGGVCDAVNWNSDNGCYQFVGKNLAVGPAWQEVVIRFDELRLVRDTQNARRLDTAALYDILFNFQSAQGDVFELLIDDLAFVKQGSLACR